MVDTIVAVLITKIQCRMVGVRPKYIEYVSTVIKYAIQEKKQKNTETALHLHDPMYPEIQKATLRNRTHEPR